MTKGERTELRSIVRQQFKVLQSEVLVRRSEFEAEVDRELADGRYERRRAAFAEIGARIQAALMQLQRQEADVLRTLAIDAIESAAAQEFLRSIPTVAELVPAQRLAALEATFEDDDGTSRP